MCSVSGSCKLTAVLRDEVYQEMEFIDVFCGEVSDKKCISSLVNHLNAQYPLTDLVHLKRVKSGQGLPSYILIMSAKNDTSYVEQQDSLKLKLSQDPKFININEISIFKVAKWKPITRKQYESASASWPTLFHEDKRLELMLSSQLFSAEVLSNLEGFMKVAIQEAKLATAHGVETGAEGAAIVDPQTGRIVAQAHIDASHPLKHAVMLCIDNVAKDQGGGVWREDGKTSHLQERFVAESTRDETQESDKTENIAESTRNETQESDKTENIAESTRDETQESDKTEKVAESTRGRIQQTELFKSDTLGVGSHAAVSSKANLQESEATVLHEKFITKPTERMLESDNIKAELRLSPSPNATAKDTVCLTSDVTVTSSATDREKEVLESDHEPPSKRRKKSGPYLCTGCAMALLHSRIRRVFYGCLDAATGGLGSKYKINVQQGLNHHFEVFRGLLEQECQLIM